MSWWQILLICFIVIALLIACFNRKVRLTRLLRDQFHIYYVKRNGKQFLSVFDIFCFLVIPLFISSSIVWGFGFWFDSSIANIVLTIASILFSVLFTILSIITSKIGTKDIIERTVIKETFTTISCSTTNLLIGIALLIIYTILLPYYENQLVYKILTNIILFILMHSFLLLLMTIKRFYMVFNKDSE